MMTRNASYSRARPITVLAVLLAVFYGCSGEPDPTFVDFSRRLTIKQPGEGTLQGSHFKVAVGSMISAQETVVHYRELLDYIARKLGRGIQLVQRKTYGEINELIGQGRIDFAFICSGPYATGREKFAFEALAMPQVRGSYLYHSYLIVNRDSPFQTLDDLKNKIFAFTDPESNTGKLVPTYWLQQRGETPETFFDKIIYTYSHDNSIMAVAKSLVDGAAVHGQIWEYYNQRNPAFTAQTRIIKKSKPFGNSPVVASAQMPDRMKAQIRELLYHMHLEPDGKKILDELMIDRFIAPQNAYYRPILEMAKDSTS